MLTEERFARILEIVNNTGSVTVQNLMAELDASESTVRRDLTALDADGRLTKVHGGAVSKNMVYRTSDDAVRNRKEQNREAKERIGRYAAGLIRDNDFVYLDAGTTTERLIESVVGRNVTFVTNAVTHARLLAEQGYTVYLLGGEFKAVTEAIVGEEALEALEKYNFTKGFWGTNGVSLQKGFSTPEPKEAMVKKRSMMGCRERYVLADASKFNQISSITFASFESAVVITTGLNEAAYQKCENIINI